MKTYKIKILFGKEYKIICPTPLLHDDKCKCETMNREEALDYINQYKWAYPDITVKLFEE